MKTLTLEKYIISTRAYYKFFDGLLHKEKKETKKNISELLKNLGINDSTYRRERIMENVSNLTLRILLNHFKYNDICSEKIKKYEVCIQKIYYNTYFWLTNEIEKYLIEIENYIDEDNYLKPLFILFKIFGNMILSSEVEKIKMKLLNEINYLLLFDSTYFIDEFELIYISVMFYFGYDRGINKINKLISKYNKLSWVYYNILGSKSYLRKEYTEALINYNKALEIYKYSNNVERIMATISNIGGIYNNLNQYNFCIDILKDAIDYRNSDKFTLWIKYIIQHYIHALLMLKEYQMIVNFFQEKTFEIYKLNSPAAVDCILASYMIGQYDKSKQIIEQFKEDKNVKIICEYIKTNRYEVLEGLKEIKQFNDLISIIKFFNE